MNHSEKLYLDSIIQNLTAQIQDVMNLHGGFETITPLNITKPIADDTIKLKISDSKGKVVAIALCSSSASQQLVERNMDRASQIRGALNSKLGAVIIEPITSGQIDDLSYTVLPYYEPISENRLRRFLQRQYLRPQILRWLRQAANDTISKPSSDELRDLFLLPLEQIVSNTRMNSQIHKAAIIAIERLSTEQWRPYFVIAHNDFWEGNLLLNLSQKPSNFNFIIIDWPGGEVKGHAIFDLLRIARSFNLSSRKLFVEVQAHCQILDCATIDAMGYLLASLGYLGMHLECFPMNRYIEMTEECFFLLEQIIHQEEAI